MDFFVRAGRNLAEAEKKGLSEAGLAELMEEHRRKVNNELPEYSRLARIKLRQQEFEKTPTNKIKRFLYAGRAG